MTPDDQLYQCSSCDRRARVPGGHDGPWEFCGGPLRQVWGLGQLAPSRGERNPASSEVTSSPT